MLKNILLSYPQIYLFSQRLFWKDYYKFLSELVPAKDGDIICDIGCGPSMILEVLPRGVEYYGFDLSECYIRYSSKRYAGQKAHFKAERVSNISINDDLIGKCDWVFAFNIVHHIDVAEAGNIYLSAYKLLKPGGIFVEYDTTYFKGQNRFAKFIAGLDRGKFIKNDYEYIAIAKHYLKDGSIHIKRHDNLTVIPGYAFVEIKYIKNGSENVGSI